MNAKYFVIRDKKKKKKLEIANFGKFSSHWFEKIVFSLQLVDVLNYFIGCQQNWWKKYHLYHVNKLKSKKINWEINLA